MESAEQNIISQNWDERIELRPAEIGDLEEILEIEQKSFRTPWSRQMFLRELELAFSYHRVARLRINNQLVGYIFCWSADKEASILSLAVNSEFRRQGIGAYILESALRDFKEQGIREAWLEARVSNFPAIALYQRLDFSLVGLRLGYYQDTGEDALVMKKELLPR